MAPAKSVMHIAPSDFVSLDYACGKKHNVVVKKVDAKL
jgi:hypothetical protein